MQGEGSGRGGEKEEEVGKVVCMETRVDEDSICVGIQKKQYL